MVEEKVYISDLSYPIEEKKCLIYRIFGQVPARLVLYLLSWSGFLVSFMMRNDINLTIVAMVEQPQRVVTNASKEYCYVVEETNSNIAPLDYGGTLKWTSKEQSYILASFYWAYIISQIVGGLATQKLGTKRVFGYAQLATALCSICIPWASETHYGLVIGLRFIQGFASGLTWPAMYALVGHWIPVPERSRFMSSFQGFSIGIGITYPLCGFLIAHLGWRSVFYTTGSIGILWCVIWYLLAFDSPETHPRISLREQQYIKENTNNTYENSRTQAVPWKKILTSLPAWSIGVTTFGRIWVHYIFIVSGPTYMKSILGFSIEKNGLLSGAPFICSYVASVLFCYIADKLITNNYMSLTNVRKLMTALSQVVPGVLVLLISYLGCDINLILVVWFIAVTVVTASYAGAMANVVDIAPNFAGPVLAFAQTIHMSASFLSPLVAFHMLEGQEQNMSAWRNVFYVTCFIAVVTYIAFQIWGTGDVQPWNYHGLPTTTPEQEELMNEKSPEKKYPNNTDEVQA
ncbi:sialin isoform X1 [Diabrotica virgifera virgifera]|uniref:Major facilitator superfamily (MFS) profile domain-containing protein n=1 Tax=Diabrotica virgifera virgifera TaxID=50390 RepID=A0ABM5JNA0_DIAVI|nr:sialin isoform X1 [Diabrotica virgifera virgifera]XP_050499417.1 sialin isoform X1 [Diabrotica virgifera virgifera]XP_050499418.1 sialin isoform X1 [Diabrotica virgifera virgifera]XP_050499419.1 sialin isoform X1 [Diabrotica virgifera virgifera]